MKVKKLNAMPYAQAHVTVFDSGRVVLTSYSTDVAEISADGWLTIHGLYSMTTRKHISAFAREYANIHDFQTVKVLVNNHLMMDINTGEVRDV